MSTAHARNVLSQWEAIEQRTSPVIVDGESLTLAQTATLGKYGGTAILTQDRKVLDRIDACVAMLNQMLQQGKTVYGEYRAFHHRASEVLNQTQGSTQDTVVVRMFVAAMARCTSYSKHSFNA